MLRYNGHVRPPDTTKHESLGTSKHKDFHINRSDGKGFTLIEVVVAMVLVSMLTLILALAFRMTLQTWERGNREAEALQLKVVLPTLVARQLLMVVTQTSFVVTPEAPSTGTTKAPTGSVTPTRRTITPGGSTPLDFVGQKEHLSFFTHYSPQGTPAQGLLRVSYRYDPDRKTLEIYEQVIGGPADLEKSDALGQSKPKTRDGEDQPVTVIPNVLHFSLSFSDGGGKLGRIVTRRSRLGGEGIRWTWMPLKILGRMNPYRRGLFCCNSL